MAPGTPVGDFYFLDNSDNCPGHGSVVDVDGEWWLYYHAWINGDYDY